MVKSTTLWLLLRIALPQCLLVPAVEGQRVTVVNIIPPKLSGEEVQNAEPGLAQNPTSVAQLVATAHLAGGPWCASTVYSPYFVSGDGGLTWGTRCQLPGPASGTWADLTVRFNVDGSWLHLGYLTLNSSGSNLRFRLIGLKLPLLSYTATGLLPPSFAATDQFDQPQLRTGPGSAEYAVAASDLAYTSGGTTPCWYGRFLWAAKVENPPVLREECVAVRDAEERPWAQRVAVHRTGVTYVAFLRIHAYPPPSQSADAAIGDVVVLRGKPSSGGELNDFVEPSGGGGCHADGNRGRRIRRCKVLPWGGEPDPEFGWEVRRGALALAIDPDNPNHAYLAFGDSTGGDASRQTLHLLRIADGKELYSVRNATNPALAVDASGRVGFLYQQYTNGRWHHQLVVLKPTGVLLNKITMADTPAGDGKPTSTPFQGDYLDLIATGNQFLGVFSAINDPKTARFPYGVRYNRICVGGVLRRSPTGLPVSPSVDPFFFRVDVDASPNFVTDSAQRPC